MIKSANQPTTLTIFLYHYVIGTIVASNEWTEVATWMGFPSYFRSRNPAPFLIEGLAEEIFSHAPKATPTDIFCFYTKVRDFAEWLNKQQQENLLQYLLTLPTDWED